MIVANAGQTEHAQPRPIDESMLTLQAPSVRSYLEWAGKTQH